MEHIKLLLAKGLKRILNPPALRSCKIDKTSRICSGSELNYVQIDRYSYVGNKCFMVNVKVGAFCSIADKCSIGGATHPYMRVSTSPVFHSGANILKKNFADFPAIQSKKTIIENDVWIGMGAYVKSGVKISNGAVIGMGSVVTKDIPPYEIWAGNPAKKIGIRFNSESVTKLEELKWWEWNESKITEKSYLFDDVQKLIDNTEVD